MDKQLNIGIVGFGKMGILHAGILNALPSCRVKAICETESLVRKIAAKAIPQVRFYANPFDMAVEEDLDAVYVTTPISSHAPVVTELARSGKRLGIFIEKPLASTSQEALQIVERTSGFASTGMVGFQKRFLPQFARAKELLEGGALGKVTTFHGYSYLASVFSRRRGWRFRKGGGGVLLDLGPHILDLVILYFGMPSSVKAREASMYSEDVEDYAEVSFEFDSGVSGGIEVSWSKEGYRLPEIGMEVTGSNGTLKVSDYALEFEIVENVPGFARPGKTFIPRPELVHGVEFLLGDPEYCIEDSYFVSALRGGNPPGPKLIDGVGVNRVIELAHASAGIG